MKKHQVSLWSIGFFYLLLTWYATLGFAQPQELDQTQFHDRIVSLRSFENPDEYILHSRHYLNNQVNVQQAATKDQKAAATFRIVPGLADKNLVSLMAMYRPKYYLAFLPTMFGPHEPGGRLITIKHDPDKYLTTFRIVPGLADPSNYSIQISPEKWSNVFLARDSDGRLDYINVSNSANPDDLASATFMIEPPLFSGIDQIQFRRRFRNNDYLVSLRSFKEPNEYVSYHVHSGICTNPVEDVYVKRVSTVQGKAAATFLIRGGYANKNLTSFMSIDEQCYKLNLYYLTFMPMMFGPSQPLGVLRKVKFKTDFDRIIAAFRIVPGLADLSNYSIQILPERWNNVFLARDSDGRLHFINASIANPDLASATFMIEPALLTGTILPPKHLFARPNSGTPSTRDIELCWEIEEERYNIEYTRIKKRKASDSPDHWGWSYYVFCR